MTEIKRNVAIAVNLIISGALRDYNAVTMIADRDALAEILEEIQTVCDQWGENFNTPPRT